MKRIVITGKGSYIGNHIQEWLESHGEYVITQVDVITDEWKEFDFTGTDAVIHVAGIVHRPDVTDWLLYEKVNIQLPMQIADKAKGQGVKQFIFFSTMAVYGVGKKLKKNVITADTETVPTDMYGRSKLEAEKQLNSLNDSSFCVSVVRPPNVYGKGCKGNYIPGFASIVRKLPIIPVAYENVKQSMIYIDNLCECIRLLVDTRRCGIFTPQDDKAVSAVQLMNAIAKAIDCPKHQSKLFGLGIYLLSFLSVVNKAYGGVEYSEAISDCFEGKYQVVSFEEAMGRTVSNE